LIHAWLSDAHHVAEARPVVRRALGMKTCPGCQAKLHNCVKRCATCGATFGSTK